MCRLNEMGLLHRARTISSVSGGAILAGILAIKWHRLQFRDNVAINFNEEILIPTWQFCSHTIDMTAVIRGALIARNPLIEIYRSKLFGDISIQDLPDKPAFLFNTTHLETGTNCAISKEALHTYRLGYVPNPNIRLAEIIAASSACPPFFPPVTIHLNPNAFQKYRDRNYADLSDREDLKKTLSLSDAGIYDNLGVHAIRKHAILFASDASSPLTPATNNYPDKLWQFLNYRTLRPINIATAQNGNLRRQKLVDDFEDQKKKTEGALWTIKTPPTNYKVDQPINVHPSWPVYFSAISTRLKAFPQDVMENLVNWGYLQCHLSIKANYDEHIPAMPDLPLWSSNQFKKSPH